MSKTRPKPVVVMLAGPNGAGKTTVSRILLSNTLGIQTFVNADVIAQGLSGFDPESTAFEAGRIMLDRMSDLESQRASFAFETTLASRSHASRIERLHAAGWRSHLVYVWLESAELAVRRVQDRVRDGGHNVPTDVIRRRYRRSLANLFHLYLPRVHSWHIFDNSGDRPRLVAHRPQDHAPFLHLPVLFRRMRELADAQDQANSNKDHG